MCYVPRRGEAEGRTLLLQPAVFVRETTRRPLGKAPRYEPLLCASCTAHSSFYHFVSTVVLCTRIKRGEISGRLHKAEKYETL